MTRPILPAFRIVIKFFLADPGWPTMRPSAALAARLPTVEDAAGTLDVRATALAHQFFLAAIDRRPTRVGTNYDEIERPRK